MSINPKARKMLWGRAASLCSFATCRMALFEDGDSTNEATVIGEECHVIAREPNGPRGNNPLSAEERDEYSNLILMCRNHHKIIDGDTAKYTIARLHQIKAEHEGWVCESLRGFDSAKQRDEELYAAYVEEWERRVDLANWVDWTSTLFAHGHPQLSVKKIGELQKLHEWIFRRNWPGRHVELEAAFNNFSRILKDLLNTLIRHGEEIGSSDDRWIHVDKVYHRLERWDPVTHALLVRQFLFVVDLVEDLALELTRAANLLCDQIRADILHSYHLAEGRLIVRNADLMRSEILKPVYASGTSPSTAYQGLEWFMMARESQEISMGHGTMPDGQKESSPRG